MAVNTIHERMSPQERYFVIVIEILTVHSIVLKLVEAVS